jgi:serine/threonine-protein kinase
MKIDPESWRVLSRLLDEWMDLPEDQRAAWLEGLGPEHENLLPALRQMIGAQAEIESGGFLDTLPVMAGPAATTLAADSLIGPYRLVRELGQGGMGVVWLAERADGVARRPVALKLPLMAVHDRTMTERFARERDILARLEHPHIARLYDAGVVADGQSYFALEYVEGERITAYCDARRLELKARLQLFLQVLNAAQYAHTNLVVHRDLKPANILVTREGEVRLLDFGIAKLLTEEESGASDLTRAGGLALTPEYASPEQVAGLRISASSDVYSLGVVLYELLTGERPYKLKRQTRRELEDAVVEAEPVRPSQAGADEDLAAARGLSAKRLSRSLKGDLDTIVLKALGKRPEQRYATADAFAQDIGRYLSGHAVLAQPESAWYRARKFVTRNKVVVGAAAAVTVALSLGLGVALREAHVAQVQSRTAETVRTFLLDIFRANSSGNADPVRASRTTARELLDIGARKIEGALNEAPEAKLAMLETLFRLYTDLGLQDQAAALGRKRVTLAKAVYGAGHPEVARALVELAVDSGSSSFAKDRPALLKEAGTILDRNGDAGSRTRALYYLAMGNASFRTDLAITERYAARSIELFKRYPASRELVSALNLLGQAQEHQNEHVKAIASLSEAASVANSLQGEARSPLPAIYAYLGTAQRNSMDLAGAERSMRLAVETARKLKGEEHVDVIQTEYRLGVFLAQTSRPVEGLQWLKSAVDLAVRTLGPQETFHTPMAREAYGLHLMRYGRIEEGMEPIKLCLDVLRSAKQSVTHGFADTLVWKATGETDLGRYREAEATLAEEAAIRARLGPAPLEYRSDRAIASARFLAAIGKADQAAEVLEQAAVEPGGEGTFSYDWLNVSLTRADASLARNLPEEAMRQARAVRHRIETSGIGPYLKRWEAEAALLEGKAMLLMRRPAEARPLLERSVALGADVYDPGRSPKLAESQIALAQALATSGRSDEARALLARARAIHASHKELGEHYRKPLGELEALLR